MTKELSDEQLNEEICKWTGKRKNYINGPEALGNMNDAEKELTDEQARAYVMLLDKQHYGTLGAVFSTARQRGVALIHVVKPEIFL